MDRGRAPKGWLIAAAAAIVLIEVVLVAVLAFKSARLKLTALRINEAEEVLLKADKVREAWAELASQSSALKERLSRQVKSAKDVERAITAEAKSQGVTIEIKEIEAKGKRGVTVRMLVITGSGPEEKVLKMLVAVDRIPAVIETDEVKLTGVAKGTVSLRMVLRHFDLKKSIAKELKQFVDELPGVKAADVPPASLRREGRLFAAAGVQEEEALKGWPKISLSGFTSDKALFFVGGEAIPAGLGEKVTGDIVYTDKLSVNQAMLKRQSDGIEIIVTIGNPNFALRQEKFRSGTAEFMLTIQKRPSSDLLAAPAAQ
jgi:hypothetical protein